MAEKAKILVVDDEERNRVVLKDILLTQGYDIYQAVDGVEALKKAGEISPDVILLDINMPNMDGLEVIKKAKDDQALRHIPIVIITGLDDMHHRIEALKLGADDFLTKPPHMAELTARVRSLVKVKAYNDHMLHYQKELEAEVENRTGQLKKAFQQLQQAHKRLHETSLDTVFRLSRAAEYKDEDTAFHLQRMSHYAAAIARARGLDEGAVETILYAAPMHDVGKIGIPDRILLKPGKLSAEEWKIMKQHTVFGSQILAKSVSDFVRWGEVIALTHHEKWDGTGYPRSLKGTDISLAGRITAIADVFDALTSKRPYKEAFPTEKAFQVLREGRGNHFDPELVDIFFQIEDKLLEIMKQYQDDGKSILFELSEQT